MFLGYVVPRSGKRRCWELLLVAAGGCAHNALRERDTAGGPLSPSQPAGPAGAPCRGQPRCLWRL